MEAVTKNDPEQIGEDPSRLTETLVEYFSYIDFLDLIDMCEISSLWYKCAKLAFKKRYNAIFHVIGLDLYEPLDLKLALKHFGPTASGVVVNMEYIRDKDTQSHSMQVLEWIARYCGSNIKHLTLEIFVIDLERCTDSVTKLNICRLMSQLEELVIWNSEIFNSFLLFEFCYSTIRKLKIQFWETDTNTVSGLLRNFPNLNYLDIECVSEFNHTKLFELNPTIQYVVLRASQMGNELIPVACRLPNLLGLDIRAQRQDLDLSPLDNIANLERLHLSSFHGNGALIQKLAHKHSKSLKWLKLYDVHMNIDFVEQLGRFENLQLLNIRRLKHNIEDSENSKNNEDYEDQEDQEDQEDHEDNKDTYDKYLPDDNMIRDLVHGLPTLRILVINQSVNFKRLKEICRLNTNNSELLIFWGCFSDCLSKVVSIGKTTIVKVQYVRYKDLSSIRPIDLNISYDVLAICDSVQALIAKKCVAKLQDPNELFFPNRRVSNQKI